MRGRIASAKRPLQFAAHEKAEQSRKRAYFAIGWRRDEGKARELSSQQPKLSRLQRTILFYARQQQWMPMFQICCRYYGLTERDGAYPSAIAAVSRACRRLEMRGLLVRKNGGVTASDWKPPHKTTRNRARENAAERARYWADISHQRERKRRNWATRRWRQWIKPLIMQGA